MGLLAGFLGGCLSSPDPAKLAAYAFACSAQALCPVGWVCQGSLCVPDAGLALSDGGPDAGGDGGLDGGPAAGSDAGSDGGSPGIDAGGDGGLDGGNLSDGGDAGPCTLARAFAAAPTSYRCASSCNGIAFADVNGDGRLDVLAADFENESVDVLFNDAGRGLTAAVPFYVDGGRGGGLCTPQQTSLAVAPWAASSLVLTNFPESNQLATLIAVDGGLAQAGPVLELDTVATCQSPPSEPRLVFLPGPSGLRGIQVNQATSTQVALAALADSGVLLSFRNLPTLANLPTGLGIGDFNHDGLSDLAVGESALPSGGMVQIYQQLQDGSFDTLLPLNVGDHDVGDLAAGDLNNDGFVDLAAVDPSGNTFSLFLGGRGGLSATAQVVVIADGGYAPQALAIVDLDRDGLNDLALLATGAADYAVFLLPGLRDGGLGAAWAVGLGNDFLPRWLAAADLSGDGGGWPSLVVSQSIDVGGHPSLGVLSNACNP